MKCAYLALVLAACGGDTTEPDAPVVLPPVDADPGATPREVFTGTQPLQPGELVEAEMKGGVGDRAVIRLEAPVSELDWNIHAHPAGGIVTVVEELDKMTVVYDFLPGSQADWYLLLKNGGAAAMDVEVEVELYGAMTFEFL